MIPKYFSQCPLKISEDLLNISNKQKQIAIYGKTKNINLLSKFTNLQKIWIFGINQNQAENIFSNIDPEILIMNEIRTNDLKFLNKLKKIKELSLTWSTKITDIKPLAKLTNIKILQIQDFSSLHDISPLKNLINIKILDLSGGMWNKFKIKNLKPLTNLVNLKYLCLTNIGISDDSLNPLSKLTALKELYISNQFPTEEYAYLSVHLKNTKCTHFKPFIKFSSSIEEHDIMIVGKRKPFLNSKKDKEKIEKYINKFEKLQKEYKTSNL